MRYRYRKDDELKDSGVEWIGKIPRDWDVKSVKHLVSKNEYYPIGDGDHGSIKPEMYQEEGIPYVRVQNLTWGNNLDFTNMVYISKEVNNQNKKSILKPKDILIAKTGATVGKTAIIPEDIVEANTTSSVGKVTVNHKNINYKYVAYYFQSKSFITQINLTAYQKSAQPGFNIDDLVDYKVSLPNGYKKQEKIANFLDEKTSQFDLIISKKEKLIERLEEAKKSLISEVVTGKVKVVKTDDGYEIVKRKRDEMKDSGVEWLGEIPKDWEVKKIKHVISEPLKYGANESAELENREFPRYIRITDFKDNGELKEDTFKSLPFEKAKDYLIKEGDILFARSGGTVGKTFLFKNYDGSACFAGYLIKATPNINKVKSEFLYAFTKSKGYENWKNSIFMQATIQNIGADKYKELKFSIPSITEQNKICEYLKYKQYNFNKLIKMVNYQIEKLKEAKQSLISEAVTGKIEILD